MKNIMKITVLAIFMILMNGCDQTIQENAKYSVESMDGRLLGYATSLNVYDNGCKRFYSTKGELTGKICGTFLIEKTEFEIKK